MSRCLCLHLESSALVVAPLESEATGSQTDCSHPLADDAINSQAEADDSGYADPVAAASGYCGSFGVAS